MQLFFELLAVKEIPVDAAQRQQFFMGSVFSGTAVVEYQNMIGMLNRGNPVGDDQVGFSASKCFQVLKNLFFGIGVNRGEGIVQDQDRCVADQRAGNGGALFLTAGYGNAALADAGLVALRKHHDIVMQTGSPGSRFDDCMVWRIHAESNVVFNGIGKQKAVLRHACNLLMQHTQGNAGNRHPVNADHVRFRRIIQAFEQTDDGGFSAAGVPDNGQRFPGTDADGQILKDRNAMRVRVGKSQMIQGDAALQGGDIKPADSQVYQKYPGLRAGSCGFGQGLPVPGSCLRYIPRLQSWARPACRYSC